MKDQGSSITGSRAYKAAQAEVFGRLRPPRTRPLTAGKARRRKGSSAATQGKKK